MGKRAYLAIGYVCNERCRYCPCSTQERKAGLITDFAEIKNAVDRMAEENVTEVTVSGGEPTMHPELCKIVEYVCGKGMKLTILSNGERFSDGNYVDAFLSIVDVNSVKVITTIHSDNAEQHEAANQTAGSFQRTVRGLLNLSEKGVRVIVKHCITRENYRGLTDFYMFCEKTFAECVDIQLCSIDYCGMPKDRLADEMLPFQELRSHLEKMFDLHIEQKQKGGKRNLYCINMPLCSCDVFYWKDYIQDCRSKMYDGYKDPHKKDMMELSNNVGPHQEICRACKVYSLCSGTYHSAFQCFGSEIVRPFV